MVVNIAEHSDFKVAHCHWKSFVNEYEYDMFNDTSRKVTTDFPFPAVQQIFEDVKAIEEVVCAENAIFWFNRLALSLP